MYGSFFGDQVANADVILINKADIVSEDVIRDTVCAVQRLNPYALVFRTVRAGMSEPLPEHPQRRMPVSPGSAHFRFDTISLKVRDGIGFSSVKGFFEETARGKYGDVVRAKALVRTGEGAFRFDLSYGKVETVPFGNDLSDSRIVIIGERLDRDRMKECLADKQDRENGGYAGLFPAKS